MMRLITGLSGGGVYAGVGGLHTAFGIDQERAGDDDALSGGKATGDLDTIAAAPAGADRARFEVTIAGFDEDDFAEAGIDDGVARNDHAGRRADGELDIHVHVRLEGVARIGGFEAKL